MNTSGYETRLAEEQARHDEKNDYIIRLNDAICAGIASGLEKDATILRLEVANTYLRDYAISKAIEVRQASSASGVSLSREEIGYIIGGIDGNVAVAMDRATIAASKGPDDGR